MRHTLIIGGTRGIGRAAARALVDDGHVLSIVSRRSPPAKLKRARYWQADVADADTIGPVLERILQSRGPLTHLVFLQRYRGEADDWDGEMRTTLTATRNVIERLADAFDRSSEKSIVLMGSVASRMIADEQSAGYHVAKAGLVQMARYYAIALASRGIRVNAVSPGIVLKDEARAFYRGKRELLSLYRRIIPRGRMTEASEIAQVVAFLCSWRSSAINGQEIIADAGLSNRWQESLTRSAALKNLDITRRKGRKK
jgi:NAD(P)-dependent dehydrogenase (short-subunit alcohol dehydrogenase family)